MNYYRQCILENYVTDQNSEEPFGQYKVKTVKQTTWIPEQYAHVGNFIKLKQNDGSWENGWKVIEVGTRLSEEYVLEHERDYKTQRKGSDI